MIKEKIVELAASAGAKAALEEWERLYQVKKMEQRNSRLWNTRILLKNFRSLKEYCDKAVYNQQAAVSEVLSPVLILESMQNVNRTDYIDSIKNSVIRTKTIMMHIEQMIKIYKSYCQISGKAEDMRRYRILEACYLLEDSPTVEEICKIEGIDRSTFYRDKNETTEVISALIFGADGLSAMRQR